MPSSTLPAPVAVLADANFPAASVAAHCPDGMVRCDGVGIPVLLDAVCTLLPLDDSAPPVALMDLMEEHKAAGMPQPSVWADYQRIVDGHEGRSVPMDLEERFAFYERAKRAVAVVATGEGALYGNIILKKGVLPPLPPPPPTGAEETDGGRV